MACPNCDHTMATIVVDNRVKRTYCDRCGTLKDEIKKDEGGVFVNIVTPKLVKRCRDFQHTLPPNTHLVVWTEMGIAEAINPPGQRVESSRCSIEHPNPGVKNGPANDAHGDGRAATPTSAPAAEPKRPV